MKIFEKRPLSLILCIMLGGFSLFSLSDLKIKLVALAFGLTILGISFIRNIFSLSKIKLIRASAVCFIFSILLSILWQNNFFPQKFDNQAAEVEAEVIEVRNKESYSALIIETKVINNEEHKYTMNMYLYDQYNIPTVGDIIYFTATIRSLSNMTGNESSLYLLADKISATCYNVTDLTFIGHTDHDIYDVLTAIRNSISSILIRRTNEETGGFVSALLIGDRSHLDANTALLFRRIGISHILALSGLHLSIITYAVLNLLSFLKIRKKISVFIIILFTIIYMALVGFTPSITRAGIMLIIHYTLFLIARTHDSFTSLSIAVFIIIIFSPHTIFDISLWLSAFATLGIISLSELAAKRNKGKNNLITKPFIWVINSLSASAFAVGCTLVFTISRFDTFSLLSIISTLIFTPIIQIFIYLSIAMILFGGAIPFEQILIPFSNGIKHIADYLSNIDWALCSSDFPIVKFLAILFTTALFSFIVFEIKKKRIALTLIILLLVSVFATGAALTEAQKNSDITIYSTADTDNLFFIKASGTTTIIYHGEINSSVSYDILDLCSDEKLTHIDNLLLLGYNEEMTLDVSILINNILVKYIYLPPPLNEQELEEAEKVAMFLSNYSSRLRFTENDEPMRIGSYDFSLLYRSKYTSNESSECVFNLKDTDINLVYFSKSAHLAAPLKVREIANQADTLIIGNGIGNDKFNLFLNQVSTIICSNEKVIDKELLEYLKTNESIKILVSKETRLK